MLAARLHECGVAVGVIENALLVAAARRLMRPCRCSAPRHDSFAGYFLPVIEEVLDLRVSPDSFQYLRRKIERVTPPR
jgi:hypothetical protein